VVATAGIDLSIASAMTLAAVVFGVVFDVGLLPAILAALVAGLAVGLLKRSAHRAGPHHRLHRDTGHVVGGLGNRPDPRRRQTQDHHQPVAAEAVDGHCVDFRYSFLIAITLAVLAHVVLFHTRFGTYVLATGGNSEAAAATGVSTARIKIAVYVIAGLTAGIASILLVARVGAAEPAANTAFLLNSVAGRRAGWG